MNAKTMKQPTTSHVIARPSSSAISLAPPDRAPDLPAAMMSPGGVLEPSLGGAEALTGGPDCLQVTGMVPCQ